VDANWNLVNTRDRQRRHHLFRHQRDHRSNPSTIQWFNHLQCDAQHGREQNADAADLSDGSKAASTSPSLTVNVGAFVKLQLLSPGEAAAPGTASGKTGTTLAQNAGTAFNVTVNAVDANWNVVTNVTHTIGITSSDSNATLPANAALVSGTKAFGVTLKPSAPRRLPRRILPFQQSSHAAIQQSRSTPPPPAN